MYQGTNPAALTSRRLIAEAMRRLMDVRPYEEISVAAVCRLAGVSRQTFYTQFRSRENVVAFLLCADRCAAPDPGQDAEDTLRRLCRGYSRYVVRQESMLRILAENRMMGLLRDNLRESFERCGCFAGCVRESMRPYAADYVAAALTSITETFLRTGADPDTLEDVALSLLRGRLFEGYLSILDQGGSTEL